MAHRSKDGAGSRGPSQLVHAWATAGFLDLCTPIFWTSASVCETRVSIGSTPSWLFVEGSGDGASWNATGPLSRDEADKLATFTCASRTCDALSEGRVLMVFGDTTTAWLDAEDFPSSGAAGIQADSPLAESREVVVVAARLPAGPITRALLSPESTTALALAEGYYRLGFEDLDGAPHLSFDTQYIERVIS